MALQQAISAENLVRFIGKELEVIIDNESKEDGYQWEARSEYDAPDIDGIVYIKQSNRNIGDIVKVKIIDSLEYDLIAEEV